MIDFLVEKFADAPWRTPARRAAAPRPRVRPRRVGGVASGHASDPLLALRPARRARGRRDRRADAARRRAQGPRARGGPQPGRRQDPRGSPAPAADRRAAPARLRPRFRRRGRRHRRRRRRVLPRLARVRLAVAVSSRRRVREYVCVAPDRIAAMPARHRLSRARPRCRSPAGSAVQALVDHAKLAAGQRVLVNGASGGVGHCRRAARAAPRRARDRHLRSGQRRLRALARRRRR